MRFRSALYIGSVTHKRLRPLVHNFRYRAFWMLIDLDEIPELTAGLRLFSRNEFNLFSMYEADHGDKSATPLRVQAEDRLEAAGIDIKGGSIFLLCMPRTLGYSFNPLSVYFCYDASGRLAALLYEVHNTFGDRHSYVIPVKTEAGEIQQSCPKSLYVSPFMDMDVQYDFHVTGPAERIALSIRTSGPDGPVLNARLIGVRKEASDRALLFLFLTIPLITLKVTAAIHWEALRLWLKGLQLRRRPPPLSDHALTIGCAHLESTEPPCAPRQNCRTLGPSTGAERHSIARGLLEQLLCRIVGKMDHGRLVIQTPSGGRIAIEAKQSGPAAQMTVHSWRCLTRLLTGWDLGFAEAYMAGEWSTPDLPALLGLACLNSRDTASAPVLRPLLVLLRIRHAMNRNTRRGSRQNIKSHYDLGNSFYERWLDRGMTYSSALYSSPSQTLEDAQRAKLDRVVDLLDVTKDELVLEIGCGWGSLAERLIQQRGCTVTGLTLSKEQLAYARRRLITAGLSEKGDLRLLDYRDASGEYDRVVSIEMLEAVGQSYWPNFFDKLQSRLRPGGVGVLQVITIREDRFEAYRSQPDFIQKYIFPGGMLPTTEIIAQQIAQAGLQLVHTEFFGNDYARTLSEWRRRFESAWPCIQNLGFEARFRRMWEYYLAYCQVGFEAGLLDVGLYKISKAGSRPAVIS